MTVAELMELLEDMDESAEVRLAHQPSWALEYGVGEVVSLAEAEPVTGCCSASFVVVDGVEVCEACEEPAVAAEVPNVVYIAEGNQLGYLPGQASAALGWKD